MSITFDADHNMEIDYAHREVYHEEELVPLCDCCAERPATFAGWCSTCLVEELEDVTLTELRREAQALESEEAE